MPTPAEPVCKPRSSGYVRAVDANSDEKAREIEARELTLEVLTRGRVLYAQVNTVVLYIDPGPHDAVSRQGVDEYAVPVIQLCKAPAGRAYARAHDVERQSVRVSRRLEGPQGRLALSRVDEEHDDVSGFQATFGAGRAWRVIVNKEASETTGCLTGEFCGLSVPHDAPRGWRAHGGETDWCVVRARPGEPRPTGVMGWDDGDARRLAGVAPRGARARVEESSYNEGSCEERQDADHSASTSQRGLLSAERRVPLQAASQKACGSAPRCCI